MFKLDSNFLYFIKSTSIVFGISSLGAFGGFLFGYSFLGIFFLFTCLQYILFFSISKITDVYIVEKTKQKELDKLETLSTLLNCSYCAKPNIMTFKPNSNDRVEFTCEHCKKDNLVTMQFVVARITEPVNVPKVTGLQFEEL